MLIAAGTRHCVNSRTSDEVFVFIVYSKNDRKQHINERPDLKKPPLNCAAGSRVRRVPQAMLLAVSVRMTNKMRSFEEATLLLLYPLFIVLRSDFGVTWLTVNAVRIVECRYLTNCIQLRTSALIFCLF